MEVYWTKSCLDCFVDEKEFTKVQNVLMRNLKSIYSKTKQIKSIHRNVRRLRVGNKRLFLFIHKEDIYCVAYFDRKNAYKGITINNLKKIISKLMSEGL